MRIFTIILVFAIIVPQFALAANPCVSGTDAAGQSTASLPRCITQIYQWSLGLSAILAVLMVVLGGYKVMTAQGNAEQSTSGKGYIMSAIVGMCLLFGAYLLLNTINPDLVNFRDPFETLNDHSAVPEVPRGPAAGGGGTSGGGTGANSGGGR